MKLTRSLFIIVTFLYTALLMGCGQKGPLYLPPKDTPQKIESTEQEAPNQIEASSEQDEEVNPTTETNGK